MSASLFVFVRRATSTPRNAARRPCGPPAGRRRRWRRSRACACSRRDGTHCPPRRCADRAPRAPETTCRPPCNGRSRVEVVAVAREVERRVDELARPQVLDRRTRRDDRGDPAFGRHAPRDVDDGRIHLPLVVVVLGEGAVVGARSVGPRHLPRHAGAGIGAVEAHAFDEPLEPRMVGHVDSRVVRRLLQDEHVPRGSSPTASRSVAASERVVQRFAVDL